MFAWHIDPVDNRGVGVAFTDGTATFGNGADVASQRTAMDGLCRGLRVSTLVMAHQVHGTVALLVDDAVAGGWTPTAWLGDALPGGRPLPVADALVTRLPGIAVAVRVADCVPVALADADVGIVGVAHAGRVGLLAGVLPATVDAMVSLGARPDRVRAWIGPHVCGDCYEVPRAMADEAERVLPGVAARTSWGTPSLDLGGAAARQLAGLGLAAVERHDPCTMTTPTLFSHRRDGGKAGRQLGAAWLGLPDR